MWISELTFPHLREARDEQVAAALERRRVIAERLAEQATSGSAAGAVRGRMPRTRRSTTATPAGTAPSAEACAT